MKSLFVSSIEGGCIITQYKNVDKASKALHIGTNTINKYTKSGEVYKGFRFYNRKPKSYNIPHLGYLDLTWFNENHAESLVALIELMCISNIEDIRLVTRMAQVNIDKFNRLKRYILDNGLNDESRAYVETKLASKDTEYVYKVPGRSSSGVTFSGTTNTESIWRRNNGTI